MSIRNKSWKFWTAAIFSASLCLFALGRIYLSLTDGFSIGNISSDLRYNAHWEVPELKETEQRWISTLLDQNFTYLGKGCQSYVFESADKNYVLKFFKFQHLRTSPFWQKLPLPALLQTKREQSLLRRQGKLERLFTGCKVAYEQIPRETGVIFVHLNPTKWICNRTTIVDKLGFKYEIDLNHYAFIIQRKAIATYDLLEELCRNGETEKARQALRSMVDILAERCRKGVGDSDPATLQNMGFSTEGAVILDVGQLTSEENLKEAEAQLAELKSRVENMRKSLRDRYPQLEESFESECQHLKA